MRDVLPEEARNLSLLSARVMGRFAAYGYQRVEVPAFEYAEVLEQGLGVLSPHEAVRFVEPETGEVVALRPDMTLQVARLVSTRLDEAPLPARLCYQGSVVRRRHERSRRHRQFHQAGIELVGAPGPAGDLEVLQVATAAMHASGLDDFVLDLGHARIAGSLLDLAVPAARGPLVEALGLKDQFAVASQAKSAGLSAGVLAALVELPSLHGGCEVFAHARSLLADTPALKPLDELEQVCRLVMDGNLAPKIVVDLGEVWNFAYYSGIMFQLLAEGPGEPVGSGGRYDGLFERFGCPRAAAGFGLDLGHLAWARRARGLAETRAIRVLVCGPGPKAVAVGDAIRAAGYSAANFQSPEPLGYARAWCYSHVVRCGDAGLVLQDLVGAGDPIETIECVDIPSLVVQLAQGSAD